MTYLISKIPEVDVTRVTGEKLCGTIKTSVTMDWNKGYSQSNKIQISKQKIMQLMELSSLEETNISIVPLNSDGTEGENHTNGVFGGWFNGENNPRYFGEGHVYIEVFSDLWNWNCGLHQDVCWDDSHTVTMQYQYPYQATLLKVNIQVNFTIN
jgi:hypothetical protein